MAQVTVQVRRDHLETLSKCKPLAGVSELIWNGFDADAENVSVEIEETRLHAIRAIRVIDDGHGLPHEEALRGFESLGGSWKRDRSRTKVKRRFLHGKEGRGRFKAFALGRSIAWRTRYRLDGKVFEYKITGARGNLGIFDIESPREVPEPGTGTEVLIADTLEGLGGLLRDTAKVRLTEEFALYFSQYKDARLTYDGARIDPEALKVHSANFNFPEIALEQDRKTEANLTLVEWKMNTDRALYLCDTDGFILHEIRPRIQAPGFSFTAYLKSATFKDLEASNALAMGELHPDVRALIGAAKGAMRDHFRERAAEQAGGLVEEWKREKIYPYEGPPKDLLERTERQVFDVCAFSISSYLPDFDDADVKSKRLSFRLLRQALEKSPGTLHRILDEVLDLPEQRQKELAELLERTSLSAIINSAKVVADRLDFLRALETLLFEAESREVLRERDQLHKILADHTWIFGEQYHLTANEEGLTEVLRKHCALLGRDADEIDPVVRPDGKSGRIDLMLSRVLQPLPGVREHLVIELKRPSVDIDAGVVNQVESYAAAVALDERFRDTSTRWIFIAVSNAMDVAARRKATQRDRPPGLCHDEGNLQVWLKTWSQVISDARDRLHFYKARLDYDATRDSGLEYLQKTHRKYLPEHMQ